MKHREVKSFAKDHTGISIGWQSHASRSKARVPNLGVIMLIPLLWKGQITGHMGRGRNKTKLLSSKAQASVMISSSTILKSWKLGVRDDEKPSWVFKLERFITRMIVWP